eukprot:3012882-Pyramimonas_sp.AAC.1
MGILPTANAARHRGRRGGGLRAEAGNLAPGLPLLRVGAERSFCMGSAEVQPHEPWPLPQGAIEELMPVESTALLGIDCLHSAHPLQRWTGWMV